MKNFIFLSCLTLTLTITFIECSIEKQGLSRQNKKAVRALFANDYESEVRAFFKKNSTGKQQFLASMIRNQDQSVTACFSIIINCQKLGIERTYSLKEIQEFQVVNKGKNLEMLFPFHHHFEVFF